jgi:hypothetical protein
MTYRPRQRRPGALLVAQNVRTQDGGWFDVALSGGRVRGLIVGWRAHRQMPWLRRDLRKQIGGDR